MVLVKSNFHLPQTKVMFLQVFVCLSTGARAWPREWDMRGKGGHVVRGSLHGKGGHAWWGSVHGRGRACRTDGY